MLRLWRSIVGVPGRMMATGRAPLSGQITSALPCQYQTSMRTLYIRHDSSGRKTNALKTFLKAKQKRLRRGKSGGPPKNQATFLRFASGAFVRATNKDVTAPKDLQKVVRPICGFRKEVTFLPNKLGFRPKHLHDDPQLVVPIA